MRASLISLADINVEYHFNVVKHSNGGYIAATTRNETAFRTVTSNAAPTKQSNEAKMPLATRTLPLLFADLHGIPALPVGNQKPSHSRCSSTILGPSSIAETRYGPDGCDLQLVALCLSLWKRQGTICLHAASWRFVLCRTFNSPRSFSQGHVPTDHLPVSYLNVTTPYRTKI